MASPYPRQAHLADDRDGYPPRRDYEPVDLSRVEVKGKLGWWAGGIVSGGALLLYAMFSVMQFWHQAELFRTDVIRQLIEMNSNIRLIATDGSVLRAQDLGPLCMMAQRDNPGLVCPAAWFDGGITARIKTRRPFEPQLEASR